MALGKGVPLRTPSLQRAFIKMCLSQRSAWKQALRRRGSARRWQWALGALGEQAHLEVEAAGGDGYGQLPDHVLSGPFIPKACGPRGTETMSGACLRHR